MRIAMFTDCYKPIVNGVVSSISCLKETLVKKGHEIIIFCPGHPGHKDTEDGLRRFYSFTFPLQPEERVTLPFPSKHLKNFEQAGFDCIHIHTPFNLGFIGRRMSKKHKIPMVFTHHTLWEEYVHYIPFISREWLRKKAISLCRGFCNSSNCVIAPSAMVKDKLISQGVKSPIEVVPSGITAELFKCGDASIVRKKYKIPPEKRILTFAGRIGKEKSIDFLLEAYRVVIEEFPDVHLFILGDGPERKNLENLAKSLRLMDNITFTGYVPREEISNYYSASYLFIFSSLTETQGLVMQEAMSCGCPVVAVDATGSSETVRNGIDGFLTPFSKEEFSSKILLLLGDKPLRERFSESAAKDAHRFYTDHMGEKVIQVYLAAIESAA